jgi:hypothetical protein
MFIAKSDLEISSTVKEVRVVAKKKVSKARKNSAVVYPSGGGMAYWSYFLVGVGAGILVTNPLINPHPLRWGAALVVIGLALFFMPKK